MSTRRKPKPESIDQMLAPEWDISFKIHQKGKEIQPEIHVTGKTAEQCFQRLIKHFRGISKSFETSSESE